MGVWLSLSVQGTFSRCKISRNGGTTSVPGNEKQLSVEAATESSQGSSITGIGTGCGSCWVKHFVTCGAGAGSFRSSVATAFHRCSNPAAKSVTTSRAKDKATNSAGTVKKFGIVCFSIATSVFEEIAGQATHRESNPIGAALRRAVGVYYLSNGHSIFNFQWFGVGYILCSVASLGFCLPF